MITVDWDARRIFVPKSYLTMLTPLIYELDVNQFRLDLKELESTEGISFLDTHFHNTAVTLSGITYARLVAIINGYEVEFEDGLYAVSCTGANHNLYDVKVVNSVSLIINNSAGLIVVNAPILTSTDLDAIDAKLDPDGKLKKQLVMQRGPHFNKEVL